MQIASNGVVCVQPSLEGWDVLETILPRILTSRELDAHRLPHVMRGLIALVVTVQPRNSEVM